MRAFTTSLILLAFGMMSGLVPLGAQDCPAVPDQYMVSLDPCRAVAFIDELLSNKELTEQLEEVLGTRGVNLDLTKFFSLSRATPSAGVAPSASLLLLTDVALDAFWGPVTADLEDLGVPYDRVGARSLLVQASPREIQALQAKIGESKLLSFLQQRSILAIEPNFLVSPPEAPIPRSGPGNADGSPNDPYLQEQWAVKVVGLDKVWADGHVGMPTFPVAVIDSGYTPDHPDLVGNLWMSPEGHAGRAFCEGCGTFDPYDLRDSTGHGTAIAGIIGARTNNGYGIAGVNWYPDLMILKVFLEGNAGAISDVVAAIYYAIGYKAGVITAAWGGRCHSSALLTALKAAEAHNVLVVAAAGNAARSLDVDHFEFYPASYKHFCPGQLNNMIVVGATDCRGDRACCKPEQERRAEFSNWGPESVEIGAPGVGILAPGLDDVAKWPRTLLGGASSPLRPKKVSEVSGTSAAVALVAGSAALVASALAPSPNQPRPKAREVRCRLLCGAKSISYLTGSFTGGRRLDVKGALDAKQCRDDSEPLG